MLRSLSSSVGGGTPTQGQLLKEKITGKSFTALPYHWSTQPVFCIGDDEDSVEYPDCNPPEKASLLLLPAAPVVGWRKKRGRPDQA